MNDINGQYTVRPTVDEMARDMGLKNFMFGVYMKMALGLLLTGVIAWTIASTPSIRDYFFVANELGRVHVTLLGMLAEWLPAAILLIAMFTRMMQNPAASGFIYWLVVASIGVSGATWFMLYNLGNIASVFLITASAFGAMSLWGYTTKRDLSGWGKFLFMAMWGVFLAVIASMFVPGINLIVSVIGVVLFAAFTAYDTQKLKAVYYQIGGSQARMSVATNLGALNFYLDFINMFQFILSMTSRR